MREAELRRELVAAARRLLADGLSHGTSGNLSVRCGADFLVTPTGIAADQLTESDVVRLAADGGCAPGQRRPSSEWPMHAAVYAARSDAGAIVHCHSRFATALACLGREIPAFHYMVAVAGGGRIPCAPYATFGTSALAASAAATLVSVRACLLANHGQLALGADIASAYRLAGEVEQLAAMYHACLAIGEPQLLPAEEMATVLEAFRHYGQQV